MVTFGSIIRRCSVISYVIGIFSIFRGERGLSLSKAVGFDRLNQRYHDLLRRDIIGSQNVPLSRDFQVGIRLSNFEVTNLKHIIAILFVLIDIIVFAGLSWATGDFTPPPTATPVATPTAELVIATPTLTPPGQFFPNDPNLP